MDNQDKIFNKIKSAAQKAEHQDFPGMEKVWSRVEEKLDKKEDKKAIVLWKKLTIAASMLLFFSLGYQFFKADSKIILPNESNETKIVLQKNEILKDSKVPSENIKTEATEILQKQIEKKNPVAVIDNPIVSSKDDNQVISKAKAEESAVQADGILSQESNSTLAVTPMAAVAAKSQAAITNDFKEKAIIDATADKNNKKTITGILTDENDNLPIPGAIVSIKGTKNTAVTGIDGKFSIEAEKGEQLIFNTIGYNTAYATVEKSNEIKTKLTSSTSSLSEVVVVGYGTSSQKKQAKMAASISAAETAKAIVSKKEKSVPQIKDALYIINGVEYSEASLFGIKPTSPYAPLSQQIIKKIEVLRSEKATAKFGEKGKNGVIIITTKNGIPLKR